MNRILHIEVNIWIALITFALAAGLAVAGTVYLLRDFVHGYNIAVPEGFAGKPDFVYGAWPALQNADFFAKVKNDFIAQKADFVETDLSSMTLRVYKQGVVALEVPIKTKGKEGSWWETPSGLYKAEGKEKTHFSSFGKVYTPWNIQFQGNFFIHGWPTYPDGKPVSSSYSGGCIRLSDEDAKAVYDLVDVGTPIVVFEKDFGNDNFTYNIIPPSVTAESYLVADLKSNFVLLSKSSGEARHAPFVPKIMSALIASEFQSIEKPITVSQDDIVPSARPRLTAGATYTVYDLLFPLLLESSGEAAMAMVHPLGRTRAVGLMKAKAQALGMTHTQFKDPAGIDEGNVATAEDAFQLAKYLYNNRPFILKISADVSDSQSAAYGKPAWNNIEPIHPFIDDRTFFGGMVDMPASAAVAQATEATSTEVQDNLATVVAARIAIINNNNNVTDAAAGGQQNLLAIFEYSFHGEKRPIAVIVLNSQNAATDAAAMSEYIKKMYQ